MSEIGITLESEKEINGIQVKYFEGATELKFNEKGNWVDVYANEDVHIDFLQLKLIKLGFAMNLPDGIEAHLSPRSSTFKTWGIIQSNSVGVIDETFRGDNDEWKMPVISLRQEGSDIKKGDKIGQFRLIKAQDKIEFIPVESFGNKDRNGFGSTGTR